MVIDLIQGDCLELMRGMSDKSVDLVLTDPPYGKSSDRGTNGFGTAKNRRYAGGWDSSRPSREVFDEMFRVGRNVILFGGNFFADMLPPSNSWIFWDKEGDIGFKNPFADGELIYTTYNKPVRRIVFIQQGFITDSKDRRFHPTQKPSELVQMLIEQYTAEGATVLDCYMGSGTTGIACVNTNRSFIGMELDPHYFEIARTRIEEAKERNAK